MKFLILAFLILQVSSPAFGKLQIPAGLSSEDRRIFVETLTSGTTSKTFGDIYSVGGFPGYSFGVSWDQLDSNQIYKLGSGAEAQDKLTYYQIYLNKGLFYNIDISIQLAPFGQSERVSGFGGSVNWGFHELSSFPLHFSLRTSANTISFQDRVNSTTQTLDLYSTLDFEDWCLSFGTGLLRASAVFLGGAQGLTAEGSTETETLSRFHYMGSVTVRFNPWFVAFNVDRTKQSAVTASLGARF